MACCTDRHARCQPAGNIWDDNGMLASDGAGGAVRPLFSFL